MKNNRSSFWQGVFLGGAFFSAFIIGLKYVKKILEKVKRQKQIKKVISINGNFEKNKYPIHNTLNEKCFSSKISEKPLAISGQKVVYWTKYGKVYHENLSCSAILHSKNIESGTIPEATDKMRRSSCHLCCSK